MSPPGPHRLPWDLAGETCGSGYPLRPPGYLKGSLERIFFRLKMLNDI